MIVSSIFCTELDEVKEVLELYRNAFNSGNAQNFQGILSDNFSFPNADPSLSLKIFSSLVYLSPYAIERFENVVLSPFGGDSILVGANLLISMAGIKDTISQAFLFLRENWSLKIGGIIEPERDMRQTSIVPPQKPIVSTEIILKKDKILVPVEIPDDVKGYMILSNSLSRTVIFDKFASDIIMQNGILHELTIAGFTLNWLKVQTAPIPDSSYEKSIIGMIGNDIMSRFIIILNNKKQHLTMIATDQTQPIIPLGDFGIDIEKPHSTINLSYGSPYPLVMADLGLGFEAPLLIDLSAGEFTLFPEFFEELPSNTIERDKKNRILDAQGKKISFSYIRIGDFVRKNYEVLVSPSIDLPGVMIPDGIAGVIGAGFFGKRIILLNLNSKVIEIYQ